MRLAQYFAINQGYLIAGNNNRISNFLLWQCAYAELYFTDVLWPDFSEDVFQQAVNDFKQRQRRFGLTGEQVSVPRN